MKINRREFFRLSYGVVGIASAAAAYALVPARVVYENLGNTFSASEAAQRFLQAGAAELMVYYVHFFQPFVSSEGSLAPAALASEARKLDSPELTKRHRLHAMPAACAAHLLGEVKSEDEEYSLEKYIIKALEDSRREVREIVTQNLTTSLLANEDTLRFYGAPRQILKAGERLIEETFDVPEYLSSCCQFVQYALTAKRIIETRDPTDPLVGAIDRHLSLLHRPNIPPQIWYVRRLAELLQQLPVPKKYIASSLLPQSSEALIGWRRLVAQFPVYRAIISHLSLIKARHTFLNFKSAEGLGTSHRSGVIERQRAEELLPLNFGFIKAFNLERLTQSASDGVPHGLDPEFQKFLQKGEGEILLNESGGPFQRNLGSVFKHELELREHVPFSEAEPRSLPVSVARGSRTSWRHWIAAFLGFAAGVEAVKTVHPFAQDIIQFISRRALTSEEADVIEEQSDVFFEAAEASAQKAEELLGERLDELDEKRGLILLDEPLD